MASTRSGIQAKETARKGAYGIDAPYLLPIPIVLCLFNIIQAILSRRFWPLFPASLILLAIACGLHSSLRGKFVVWSDLLDRLKLHGDERILDLGCGRGAVLLLAAERVARGRAIGVDLWRKTDQSGNSVEATRANAAAEGVLDRVELHTADITALPFEPDSFDVVVSNLVFHNLKGRSARRKATDEALRVLCPGGRLLIADLFGTQALANHLRQLGMINVQRENLGCRAWWSGPWLPTHLVSATKPCVPTRPAS